MIEGGEALPDWAKDNAAENTTEEMDKNWDEAREASKNIQKDLDDGHINAVEAQERQNNLIASMADPETQTNKNILGEMGNAFGDSVKNFAKGMNAIFSDILKTVTGDGKGSGGVDANFDVTTEEGGKTNRPTTTTVDANTDPGEVQNKILDAVTDALGDLTKLGKITNVKITTANGVSVEIDLNKMGDEINKNLPNVGSTTTQNSINTEAGKIRDNIKSGTTKTAEEAYNDAEAAADRIASKPDVKSAVEEANERGDASTEVNKTPQDPNKNSNWANAWILFKILRGLTISGIVAWFIFKKCKELTGCYKISGSTKGPIKQKINCDGSDSYSRKYCDCYDSSKTSKKTSKNSNKKSACDTDDCKCYPDQPRGTPAKAKYPTCDLGNADTYVYYDYIVFTPLDAIASIISDSADFFSKTGDALFNKILKWGLIILGAILGLLLIYSLIRVLATKELEKLTS